MKVTVKPVHGTNDLKFSPKLEDIGPLIRRCFMKILDVNKNIPRVEHIIFTGIIKKRLNVTNVVIIFYLEFTETSRFIHYVTEEEDPVKELIEEGVAVSIPNLIGPIKYLETYVTYLFIQNGQAVKDLEEFIDQDPLPYIKVVTSFSCPLL